MYSYSRACIKLSDHLSNEFDINKGTEQGHPLSPDLFKLFLRDLSPLLEFKCCPYLTGNLISHLLWADDLITFALDKITLQKQLDNLSKYCNEWGVEINIDKTKIMVFSNSKNTENEPDFFINGRKIEYTDSYCYLGIIIDKSGQFKLAKNNLNHKAMRALFSLKRSVFKTKLSFRALTKLFDALIKPIVLYGAPVWTPTSPIIKSISKATQTQNSNSNINLLKRISSSLPEKVHLHFLKWALGVHKKATNVAVWGDSGRYPLAYECIKLTLNYYQRVDSLNNDSLVYAALQEQKLLNLSWYKNIENLLKIDKIYTLDHVTAAKYHNSQSQPHSSSDENVKHSEFLVHNGFVKVKNKKLEKFLSNLPIAKPIPSKNYRVKTIYNTARTKFIELWKAAKSTSPKLQFYNSIKLSFSKEPYLDAIKNAHDRYHMTRLRISAHDLNIERGRYINIERSRRFCIWCKTSMGLENIEDEFHLLNSCDLYAKSRAKLAIHIAKLTLQAHNATDDIVELVNPSPNHYHSLHPKQDISLYMYLEINPTTQSLNSLSRNIKSQLYIKMAHFIHGCLKIRHKFITDAS